MSRRTVTFAEKEFYHIYNRGVDRRQIFLDESYYQRFKELLFLSNSTDQINVRDLQKSFPNVFEFERSGVRVAIGAYCLMPNHFHLLVTPLGEAEISAFVGKLCTSFSSYFNKRNHRTGSLFQSRFKAEHVDSDEYLKYLYAYIHLNPIKLIQSDWREAGIRDTAVAWQYLETFPHSSLPFYLGKAEEANAIINPNPFPEYFQTALEHRDELLEWLNYGEATTV